jgi:hypothetical protein
MLRQDALKELGVASDDGIGEGDAKASTLIPLV